MKRFVVALLMSALLVSVTVPVFCEDQYEMPPDGGPPAQDPMQAMQQMQEMMVPMSTQIMEMMVKAMAKKEFSDNLAAFTRNYYESLVKKGFSEEQAIQIVISAGTPNPATKR